MEEFQPGVMNADFYGSGLPAPMVRRQPGGRTPELPSEISNNANTAAPTASPPQRIAELNVPSAECTTKCSISGAQRSLLRFGTTHGGECSA